MCPDLFDVAYAFAALGLAGGIVVGVSATWLACEIRARRAEERRDALRGLVYGAERDLADRVRGLM